jgi:hypothetical protein
MPEYRVLKSTGTYSDTLITLGLARLLDQYDAPPVLRENPDAYLIVTELEPQITGKRLMFNYIRGKEATPSRAPNEFDYSSLKSAWEQHFKMLADNKGIDLSKLDGYQPPPHLNERTLITTLVDLLKPVEGSTYDTTFDALAAMNVEAFIATIKMLLTYYKVNNGIGLEERWKVLAKTEGLKAKISAVMAFNPMMGKGINAAKANSVSLGGGSELLPIEMLKFAGWWAGTVSATPRGTKDRKVLCVTPSDISFGAFEKVVEEFRAVFRGGGAVQMDVLAALRLTLTLLERHPQQITRRWRPRSVVRGLHVAHFQNLGSAKGVSNLSFIGLPEWVVVEPVSFSDDIQTWRELLQEHDIILRRLDESRTEQYNLLLLYRDFLSGGRLEQFLDFLVVYGAFALAKADRERTLRAARALNPHHIGKVVIAMSQNLSTILDNEGFQNVATAIRRATRGALYAKLKGERTYPVHYGLAQELARKALYKNDFISALSEFITKYNTENMRAAERDKKRRADVSTNDITNVVRLLEEHDAQTVAKLLIAFGYAKSPFEATDDPPTESDTEPNPDEEMTPEEVES